MADGCIFCRIIAGELPAHVVIEDDADRFLDARPVPRAHAVVPREHVVTSCDLPAEQTFEPLFSRAQLGRHAGRGGRALAPRRQLRRDQQPG